MGILLGSYVLAAIIIIIAIIVKIVVIMAIIKTHKETKKIRMLIAEYINQNKNNNNIPTTEKEYQDIKESRTDEIIKDLFS